MDIMRQLRLLLDRGAYVNTTADGNTALSEAAHHGHEKVVRLLLQRDACTSARANCRKALMFAARKDIPELLKLWRVS